MRLCEISDWPDTARRGYLEGFWKDSLEFALFNKMNSVSSQHGPFVNHLDAIAELFTELELDRLTTVEVVERVKSLA